uniref:G protein-coupled receptor n=1 Tax=Moniliophthora roreri TaxID=221103 RepID=A0A0W0GEL2_MONRR
MASLLSLLSVQRVLILPIVTLLITYLLYGFYILLFGTCVHIMRGRQPVGEGLNRNLYLSLTVILFVLTTAFIVDYTVVIVSESIAYFTVVKTRDSRAYVEYAKNNVPNTVAFAFQSLIPVLLNIAADYMLIHRCYVIWSSSKRVAIPLIVASVGTNALGATAAIVMLAGFRDKADLFAFGITLLAGYIISCAIVNSMVTLLTAGRIWWIHRSVRAHGVQASDTLLHSVSRIVLESGLLYPFCIITSLIVGNTTNPNIVPFDFQPIVVLSAGIAPTLILVRAKLGKTAESMQNQISDIRFTSRTARRTGTMTVSQAQVHSIEDLNVAALEVEQAEKRKEVTSLV